MLKVLADHPQRVLTRDQLLSMTQNREADIFDRSVDILISRLRKRMRQMEHTQTDNKESDLIKTVRSEGYMLTAAVSNLEHR